MARLLFIFFIFFGLNCHAQAFLGKSKQEILEQAEVNFKDADWQYVSEEGETYIQIQNHYETLYYYLEDDACVRFEVVKPYTCECLEVDIEAYNANCISLGNFRWMSKDKAKLYQMTLLQESYSVSIEPYDADVLSSRAGKR